MTTTLIDHETAILGSLRIPVQDVIDSDLELLRTHGCDAFSRCADCEAVRAEILQLRKEQRMARGDFIGAQDLMR